eukprot:g652.t1
MDTWHGKVLAQCRMTLAEPLPELEALRFLQRCLPKAEEPGPLPPPSNWRSYCAAVVRGFSPLIQLAFHRMVEARTVDAPELPKPSKSGASSQRGTAKSLARAGPGCTRGVAAGFGPALAKQDLQRNLVSFHRGIDGAACLVILMSLGGANGTNNTVEEELDICEGGKGLIFPLVADEHLWNRGLRTILYLVFLGWCFLGVAIVSDIFMEAIERVTSKRKRKFNTATGKYVTVRVWNPTVANLTLMALGSSAPEILLSIIELLGNQVFAGDLGPSTIVGSAAFNLFIISAVCVMSIPTGQVRCVQETNVYIVTAIFSILAYVWLIVILDWISPNVVEIWEAVITFIFFPLLVFIAYAADIGWIGSSETVKMGRGAGS